MNKKDALEIRAILKLFDYESINLTEKQLKAIEEIEDIVYKPEYDQTIDEIRKEIEDENKRNNS